MQPHHLAAAFQQCVQAAQAGLAHRVEATLRAAAPGDPLTDELVANAHRAFPTPQPVPAQPQGGPRRMDIGGIADDDAPAPHRATRRRPPRPRADPDDWSGRSVLS
jgi:hypothetical protein